MNELSNADVRQVVQSLRPDVEIVSVDDVSGSVKETFVVETMEDEEDLVCMFLANKEFEDRFRCEERIVELVNEKTSIPTQKIVDSDLSGEEIGVPFYIVERLDGKNLEEAYPDLSFYRKKELLGEIGSYLGELHSKIQFEDFGRFRYRDGSLELESEDSWKDLLQDIMISKIEGLESTRFEDLQEEAYGCLKETISLLHIDRPCLIHYDIAPDNTFYRSGEVEAFIDWERSLMGHSELDLAYMEVQFILGYFDDEEKVDELRKAFYRAYKQEKSLKDGYRVRIHFYRILLLIEGMESFENWTEDYTEDKRQEAAEWQRKKFREQNQKLDY